MKMNDARNTHKTKIEAKSTLASSSLEISPSLSLSNNANVSLVCGWIGFEANLLMIQIGIPKTAEEKKQFEPNYEISDGNT